MVPPSCKRARLRIRECEAGLLKTCDRGSGEFPPCALRRASPLQKGGRGGVHPGRHHHQAVAQQKTPNRSRRNSLMRQSFHQPSAMALALPRAAASQNHVANCCSHERSSQAVKVRHRRLPPHEITNWLSSILLVDNKLPVCYEGGSTMFSVPPRDARAWISPAFMN